jgi:P4 family phage/plasmid primase-like protien
MATPSKQSAATQFNTIQYCIDTKVPCFTFAMDHTKTLRVKWSEITANNFHTHLSTAHNGFAIITGGKYLVIDFDSKHSPPQHIYDTLLAGCTAVEKTPGGYHFWFLTDTRTSHFKSTTDAFWAGAQIKGLDIRAQGGICYVAPSSYVTADGNLTQYTWMKGDLSSASAVPSDILEHICEVQEPAADAVTFDVTGDPANSEGQWIEESTIALVLSKLKQERVDTYTSWISAGMALKNAGYSCEIWDEWSKRSYKYRPGECHRKWLSFARTEGGGGVTDRTLYKWLKEDDYDTFIRLHSARNRSRTAIIMATNYDIAELFYSMNDTAYMFSHVEGWYVLQPNNTWEATGSPSIMSIPGILTAIRNDCYKVCNDIFTSLNASPEADSEKYKKLGDTIKKISNTRFLRDTSVLLSGFYEKKGIETRFNAKRHLFAFTNGCFDTESMTFREIMPDDYITVTCGYDYRPAEAAEKATVRAFLSQIFPSAAVLEYVLAALCTTFVGDNEAEAFHVFTGSGANGKSCLIDLCRVTFGEYYKTLPVTYLTKDDDGKSRPLPELVAARYSRMLVAAEPEERDRFQISLMKTITGGDEISCRGMYAKSASQFVPQFKLWIMANDIPRLSKFDEAIERRMRCVHFPVRFVANPVRENDALRDDSLKGRILHDVAWKYGLIGILWDKYMECGGKIGEMPAEVRDITASYMLSNNPVGAWLHEYYEITGHRNDMIQKTELYQAFLHDTGVSQSQRIFYEDVKKSKVEEKKIDGMRYYYGLVRKES